jgi:hypothetical protein
MAAVKAYMGYEAQLFYGTAGSTGATQITNATDVDYNLDPERGDTTTRGDGTAVPRVTSRVTGLKPTITWKSLNKPTDTTLAALIAAAKTGAPVALRTKSYSSGLGFDGDVTLTMKQGAPLKGEATFESPLKGEATFEFTAEATEESLRVPSLWV